MTERVRVVTCYPDEARDYERKGWDVREEIVYCLGAGAMEWSGNYVCLSPLAAIKHNQQQEAKQ